MESMLQELKGRFSTPSSSSPCDTVHELQQTIASLQQIKSGLEETKEYRAAQAEKERVSKDDRVLQLKKRVEESKAAAEKLLGFSLKPEHFNCGNVYSLMPSGYVNRQQFEWRVENLQKPIRNMEERVDRLRSRLSVNPTTKSEILQLEAQLHAMRTQLLGFLMEYQPMMDPTFSETLATHLDAMLEAYLELRTLECAETKAGCKL
jgi:DNA repair exonuclease SbcCD ATPase subunit